MRLFRSGRVADFCGELRLGTCGGVNSDPAAEACRGLRAVSIWFCFWIYMFIVFLDGMFMYTWTAKPVRLCIRRLASALRGGARLLFFFLRGRCMRELHCPSVGSLKRYLLVFHLRT